jgi:arylsulfatase
VSRPNILVIMSDQHRADMMGCAGDLHVQTPHLDVLSARGVRFSSVSCQGPLCMPARASFMTERYVRDHGVYTNWADIPLDSPTYVGALQAAGYHTTLIGKAHLYRDDMGEVAHVDQMAPRLQQLGFTEVHETGDKFASKSTANAYTDHLRDRGLLDAYQQHIADRSYQGEQESGQGATKRIPMWDATPMPIPLDAYIDTWHGDVAARWIQTYDRADPFFLFVGFPGPHDPWDAPAEALARYGDGEVTFPRSTTRPDTSAAGTYGRLLKAFLKLADTDTMTTTAIAGMRRAYCADVSVIDDAVGRILAALEQRGLLDDTWIVYTSDHGEMAGDHGLLSKCVLYTGAVKVPLIVQPPGGCSPEVVDDLVEHLDVPATLRAIAGAPDIVGSEGRSLLGHLTGDRTDPRTVSVSENWGFAAFETADHKLIVDEDSGLPCQLFDKAADPVEDTNLVASSAYATTLDQLMASIVLPFLATRPARPHPSPFTAAQRS